MGKTKKNAASKKSSQSKSWVPRDRATGVLATEMTLLPLYNAVLLKSSDPLPKAKATRQRQSSSISERPTVSSKSEPPTQPQKPTDRASSAPDHDTIAETAKPHDSPATESTALAQTGSQQFGQLLSALKTARDREGRTGPGNDNLCELMGMVFRALTTPYWDVQRRRDTLCRVSEVAKLRSKEADESLDEERRQTWSNIAKLSEAFVSSRCSDGDDFTEKLYETLRMSVLRVPATITTDEINEQVHFAMIIEVIGVRMRRRGEDVEASWPTLVSAVEDMVLRGCFDESRLEVDCPYKEELRKVNWQLLRSYNLKEEVRQWRCKSGQRRRVGGVRKWWHGGQYVYYDFFAAFVQPLSADT